MKYYKCQYAHCIHPNEKVSEEDIVIVGHKRFHKDCAELRAKIERIKNIYFKTINNSSNEYVQVLAVINNLVFKKGYSPEFIEFALKYIAVTCSTNIKSPYSLYYVVKNGIILKKYNNAHAREDVNNKYARRYE